MTKIPICPKCRRELGVIVGPYCSYGSSTIHRIICSSDYQGPGELYRSCQVEHCMSTDCSNCPILADTREVKTNIGTMPIEDYREIMAVQNGFNSYDDMYHQGYRLGDDYDKKPNSIEMQASCKYAWLKKLYQEEI